MTKDSQIEVMNAEINRQLANAEVGRALLMTTFKGLTPVSMKQAILEGMMRGFEFKDFLHKNVYAIPYGSSYSLVTSIDYARKRGMRAGIVGKDKPVYLMDGKKIISCEITVHRMIKGYVGDYTAEVYFDEYTTGRNLWNTKPKTMIAKVAEMHALRMACPEELSQIYTEEEMESETVHEKMQPYTVARILLPEEDDSQGKRSEPIAEVVPELEIAPSPVLEATEPIKPPKDIQKMQRMEIAKLLKEKADFVTLGKSDEKIGDKLFDLIGAVYAPEHYKFIIEELKNL